MRTGFFITIILCLSIFFGCLGTSKDGDSIVGTDQVYVDAVLSGRIYFADRQLYGGIPISIRYSGSPENSVAKTIKTNGGGYFYVPYLDPGVYDLVAITGDSEVAFAKNIQIIDNHHLELGEKRLICLRDLTITKVGSHGFDINFRTNRSTIAELKIAALDGSFHKTENFGSNGKTIFAKTIVGLNPETEYDLTLTLTSNEGQVFISRDLMVTTTKTTGPKELAVNINEGAFETYSPHVTLYLNAENAAQMRISETSELDDKIWINYSNTYSHSFSSLTSGSKRVYVQFMDANGVITSTQTDSILYTTDGYVGVWINGGDSITNNKKATLKTVYPEATEMLVSNHENFFNSFWEKYSENRNWNLEGEDGTKIVYVKFRGGGANEEDVFTASIELETTPPRVEMTINNGARVTATTTVTLNFSYPQIPPSHMKIANTEPPTTADQWIGFKRNYEWHIPRDDEEKEVFALFKDRAGNEYGPISAAITLDTVAPTGNSILVRDQESESSEELEETKVASLPVYLHFNITDDSVETAYYCVTVATTTVPSFEKFTTIGRPFNPIMLNEGEDLGVNDYRLWAYFADEAGNRGFVESAKLKVEGPRILIVPNSVFARSGERKEFTFELENLNLLDAGGIEWSIDEDDGSLGSIGKESGVYTAPRPLIDAKKVGIIAMSANPVKYLKPAEGIVALERTQELLYEKDDGPHEINGKNYRFESLNTTVQAGSVADVARVIILHSQSGVVATNEDELQGLIKITTTTDGLGAISTIEYTPPTGLINTFYETLHFESAEVPELKGSIAYTVAVGTNIRFLQEAGETQRGSPFKLNAVIAGATGDTVNWTINATPNGDFLGSFASNSVTYTTSTTRNHEIIFYANGLATTPTIASITAEIEGTEEHFNLLVLPPISFSLSPQHLDALPGDAAKEINAVGFDYKHANATTNLKWEFKNNGSDADFFQTENPSRGNLEAVSGTRARYTRPTIAPTDAIPPFASDTIIIRATSITDPLVSATTVVNIQKKVTVEIFNNIEKKPEDKVVEANTVAEVGKLQFFADVSPEKLTNKTVSWSIVENDGTKGSISSDGQYSAPDNIINNQVRIRATANYDSRTYAEVLVNLRDFWLPRRVNMVDQITKDHIPVSVIRVNPHTQLGSTNNLRVYSGTSGGTEDGSVFGYGVWYADFPEDPSDISEGDWKKIANLSEDIKQYEGQYIIHDMAFTRNENLLVGTSAGLWIIKGETAYKLAPEGVTLENCRSKDLDDKSILAIAIDQQTNLDNRTVFVSTPDGVFRTKINENTNKIIEVEWLLDCIHGYLEIETRMRIDKVDSGELDDEGNKIFVDKETPVTAYNPELQPNPISEALTALVYDSSQNLLYCGGKKGSLYVVNYANRYIGNLTCITSQCLTSTSPQDPTTISGVSLLALNQDPPARYPGTSAVNRIVMDMYNRSTLWMATVNGLSRSINSGSSWTGIPLSGGASTNCSTVIIDSTNTVNTLTGTEDGVYRITMPSGAFVSKRIRSGLGNHKLIRSLAQSAGRPGVRRKVWVGTSGGVFMGRESLDLE